MGFTLLGILSAAAGGGAQVEATGGTVTDLDGFRYHTFNSSGTLTVVNGGEVEYFVLGGGANGQNSVTNLLAGTGGGSGYAAFGSYLLETNETITIGAGGGSPSTFGAISANGGSGATGGSGGGGGADTGWFGGSGGSNGANGGNPGGGNINQRGLGSGVSISTTWVTPGLGGSGGSPFTDGSFAARAQAGGIYAGGGGGSSGGNAKNGVSASANTGGGGGGGGRGGSGGSGGSGVVIVRYPI